MKAEKRGGLLVIFVGLFLLMGMIACTFQGCGARKPLVVIDSPPSHTEVEKGDVVTLEATASGGSIERIELWVDDEIVDGVRSPSPVESFRAELNWETSGLGQHLVEVRAYNTAGGESEPASIILIVAHVVAEATPTVALGPSFETPTPTTPPPSAMATLTPPPGATPTSTAGSPTTTPTSPPPTATASPIPPTATPTQTTTPVPTDTPTATPTLPVLLTPPPTVVPPSFPEITIDLDQANSGAVDKDGQLYYYIAQPGDTWTNKRVKGFLSWDLSAIPGGAQILSARIAWSTECSHGASSGDCTGYRDIFQALGRLWVRAYFYDRLDVGDFASAGLQGGPY